VQSGSDAYRLDFLVALRELAEEQSRRGPDAPTLLACATFSEYDVVVLYREYARGPVLGRRYDLQAHAALFKPDPSPQDLAETVFWNDVVDPTGRGEVLGVNWADGLGVERRDIQWVGAAEWCRT